MSSVSGSIPQAQAPGWGWALGGCLGPAGEGL